MKTLTPPKPLTAAHRKAAARKVAARPKRRAY
jgi:hypothetical protein